MTAPPATCSPPRPPSPTRRKHRPDVPRRIDLSHEFPKRLTIDAVQAADVVIRMGCGDTCPVFPGKRYLDWQITDPAGLGPEQVRPIRDEIDARVRALLTELVPNNLARTRRPPAEP